MMKIIIPLLVRLQVVCRPVALTISSSHQPMKKCPYLLNTFFNSLINRLIFRPHINRYFILQTSQLFTFPYPLEKHVLQNQRTKMEYGGFYIFFFQRLQNFSPSLIDRKFNIIYTKIKSPLALR